MKKFLAILVIIVFLFSVSAYAQGILPSLEETVVAHVEAPSLTLSLRRMPASSQKTEDGKLMLAYTNVTDEDFNNFSVFLEEYGCSLADYSTENGLFSATISYDDIVFTMEYDETTDEARFIYPEGVHVTTNPLQIADIGETVFFGTYEQDNNLENGAEPIEWLVLDIGRDKAFVISKYVLDAISYYSGSDYKVADVTWEKSDLRKWLNEDFYQAAFDTLGKAFIETTTVTMDKNLEDTSIDPGNDTQDKVYIFSMSEMEKYFGTSEDARICVPTAYAMAVGELDVDGCDWWLRTVALFPGCTTGVTSYGTSSFGMGLPVAFEKGVRPVMWVSMNDLPEDTADLVVYETLSKGAKGDLVKVLQQALIDQGFLSGKADGDYGNMTVEAVKKAQTAFGMEVTGIADSDFQNELYSR